MTCRGVLDWMIGFIDPLYTPLGITGNCIAILNLRTVQVTVTPTHVLGLH
jgi:hypothetical protein